MVTIKDVAKYANTSIFSVSSVINNKKTVSVKLKKRILNAIKELNYIPNSMAAGLKRKKSALIGVIVSDIEDIFFPLIIEGIENVLNKAGVESLLANTANNPKKELDYLKIMVQKKVDGLLIVPVNEDKNSFRLLIEKQIPTVFIDREIESLEFSTVTLDNYDASYRAVDYLIDQGHKDIAIIVFPTSISTGKERLRGYKEAIINRGIVLNENLIKVTNNFEKNSSFKAANELITMKENRPTAILTANAIMFMGAYEAINFKGLEIPQDISIITFNDLEFFKYLKTSITAISFSTKKMGSEASKLLLKIIDSKAFLHEKTIIKSKLINRDSVKILKNS